MHTGDAELNSTDNPKRELSKTKIYLLYFSYFTGSMKEIKSLVLSQFQIY